MAKSFSVNVLSAAFYSKFPSIFYPEIEYKPGRPYVVMLFDIDGNKFALPLRSNIRHDYCYKFKNTSRETDSATGIDFSKAVIVNDASLIGKPVKMDQDEYVELFKKFYFIRKRFERYLKGYIKYRESNGNVNEYIRKRYIYCTLQYFDDELGL